MRSLLLKTLLVACFFLVLFVVIQFYFQSPVSGDPSRWIRENSISAAVISTGLLALDIFLPIPSSVVMILNGKLFGLLPGMFISLTGGILATTTGYLLGRYGTGKWLRIKENEKAEASRLLDKWGIIAVILTRPIPLLSESISIMSGASKMPARKMLLASMAGHLPGAFIYALSGAYASTIQSNVISFFIVIGIATIIWVISRWFARTAA